ncbi:MAG: AMP-binding protein [Bacillota bacterium]|nr:AMP-binding protein [Bacillota bacterium]
MNQSMIDMSNRLHDMAARIRELREITGYSVEYMAENTDITPEQYSIYEAGEADLPFSFIHKCALLFDVEITDLMEGRSAKLSSYTVTRSGGGQITAREAGIEIRNLAPRFRKKIAEPYWVHYEYNAEQQTKPIHLSTHSGQEFDFILRGKLKVQIGDNIEILGEGDSIYYDSSTPHGMIAVDGEDCLFCAIILPGEEVEEQRITETIKAAKRTEPLLYENFVHVEEDELGAPKAVRFIKEDTFNFAFDVVDALARQYPDKLAMLHVDKYHQERYFNFTDMSHNSSRAANYFKSLGIKRGDKVLLVLRRNYQFWFAILGLHKLGAIAIPATDQLMEHDFEYRFKAADISAIICTGHGSVAEQAELAMDKCPQQITRIIVNGCREGWHDFDAEYVLFSETYRRGKDAACGDDTMLMFFTSGTTGYPKIAEHSYKYALGHFLTGKYWHCVDPDGLHFTIAETGWGKALWGKLYGQWLSECAVFVYDFERFDAHDILPMFAKYKITSFCAPPTMYRFLIKEDLSKYDLSSIRHASTAGEALNPEVFHQFKKNTGLTIMEGFGQTETTLSIGNFVGMTPKVGSMGKPSPLYNIELLDREGKPTAVGETGEIAVKLDGAYPCGLAKGYYLDEQRTNEAWHDGYYHTGDTAWRDEDGYYWYVGRVDDLIKSSGYRIGPFEIESVIMELPYVLECGVSGAPDEVRGQVVKATVVLTKGVEPSDKLANEIQTYVKQRTAPYKYPRIVVFSEALPKTISGKIQRNLL